MDLRFNFWDSKQKREKDMRRGLEGIYSSLLKIKCDVSKYCMKMLGIVPC